MSLLGALRGPITPVRLVLYALGGLLALYAVRDLELTPLVPARNGR